MRCVFNDGNDCTANTVRSPSISANFTQEIAECPQMYPIWWSATGLTASVLLIELDRFLAIRFPLKVLFFPVESVFFCKWHWSNVARDAVKMCPSIYHLYNLLV